MKHWTENDFKQWLYGLKEPDSHTEACPDCRAELERLALTRRRVVASPEVSPEVSEEFLAAQRRAIYNRLQHAARNFAPLRWAVSIAVLLAVAISLTLPHSKNASVILTNDEQLYSDLARIEQTDEPKAIQPLHNLFEE
jgi:hypothetical protein